MTLITPELIEKAARAGFVAFLGDDFAKSAHMWDIDENIRKDFTAQTKAALSSILPDIVNRIREELGRAEGSGLTEDALWEAQEIIRMMVFCPRSMNHRPDDFPIEDCIAAGECGCENRERSNHVGPMTNLSNAHSLADKER